MGDEKYVGAVYMVVGVPFPHKDLSMRCVWACSSQRLTMKSVASGFLDGNCADCGKCHRGIE